MSDFFKSFGSSASSSPMADSSTSPTQAVDMSSKKEALKNQIRSEMQLMGAQQLMNSMHEKCFLKCVTKPSTSLSSSEETCLARCQDRYMEAFNIISTAYVQRMERERSELPSSLP